jgi:hypothetical protein
MRSVRSPAFFDWRPGMSTNNKGLFLPDIHAFLATVNPYLRGGVNGFFRFQSHTKQEFSSQVNDQISLYPCFFRKVKLTRVWDTEWLN